MSLLVCAVVGHKWQVANYVVPGSCLYGSKCIRCGQWDKVVINHTWKDPSYLMDNSCRQIRTCANCSVMQEIPIVHQFGLWSEIGNNRRTRTCSRCGKSEDEKWLESKEIICPACNGTRGSGIFDEMIGSYSYPGSMVERPCDVCCGSGSVLVSGLWEKLEKGEHPQ